MEVDLRCRKCNRWLGKATSNTEKLTIKCGNCKTNNTFNVTFASTINGSLCYSKNRTDLSEATGKGQAKAAETLGAKRSGENHE